MFDYRFDHLWPGKPPSAIASSGVAGGLGFPNPSPPAIGCAFRQWRAGSAGKLVVFPTPFLASLVFADYRFDH